MKRTILTALFALNALFCVNQMQAISWKKLGWGTGATVSALGAGVLGVIPLGLNLIKMHDFMEAVEKDGFFFGPVKKHNSLDKAVLFVIKHGKISSVVVAGLCLASAKYCYDNYKAQPE